VVGSFGERLALRNENIPVRIFKNHLGRSPRLALGRVGEVHSMRSQGVIELNAIGNFQDPVCLLADTICPGTLGIWNLQYNPQLRRTRRSNDQPTPRRPEIPILHFLKTENTGTMQALGRSPSRAQSRTEWR